MPEISGNSILLRTVSHIPDKMGRTTEPTGCYKLLYADKDDLM